MSDSAVGQFFSGSGRKTVKFPVDKPGTTFEGVITAVHEPEPQTEFESGAVIPGKFQMRIDLDSELTDPDDPDDDGKYTLYVKGWLQGAIGDALRTAGVPEPKVGDKLAVTYTGSGAPSRPGLNGPKKYSAVYTPGTAGASGFFGGTANNGEQQVTGSKNAEKFKAAADTVAAGLQAAPIPADPPAGITAEAWQGMPHDVKQAVANAAAGVPSF